MLRVGELAEPEEQQKALNGDSVDGTLFTPAQKLASKLFGVRQQQVFID